MNKLTAYLQQDHLLIKMSSAFGDQMCMSFSLDEAADFANFILAQVSNASTPLQDGSPKINASIRNVCAADSDNTSSGPSNSDEVPKVAAD